MRQTHWPQSGRNPVPAAARRFGYLVEIGITAVFVYFLNNLPDWNVLRFLTPDFDGLIGWITFSMMAAIMVAGAYLFFDPGWFKSVTQIVLNVISLVVTIRVLAVFPFDFSDFATNWSWLVRVGLIVAIVAIVMSTIAELVKLIRLGIGHDQQAKEPVA